MARWFLIFMLFVLPVQFASAAAAGYCRHESGAAGKHFGHHDHRHQGSAGISASEPDGHSASGLGASDPDCDYCQLSVAQPLLPEPIRVERVTTREAANRQTIRFDSLHPTVLDRPNWTRAASFGAGSQHTVS